MKVLRTLAFLFVSLVGPIGSAAFGQIVSTGPFTGANSEPFGLSPQGVFSCFSKRILEGTADLCAPGGQLFVGGAYHCSCVTQPIGAIHCMAGNGGHLAVNFGTPAVRFGAFFALSCNLPDGYAEFRDPTGALIATLPLTLPADCAYHWLGFEVLGGPPIGSVELFSNHPTGGALLMDEMQVDYLAAVDTYCTGKMNSLNCIPRIECDGVPRAGALSGWEVRAVRVIPGGIPGLLLYTVGGSRNAAPFQCGTLCIGPTGVRRSIPVVSTLSGILCEGAYRIDMNAFASGALGGIPSPGLSVPGSMVNCQWWGRDQGFPAPCNSTMSDALEYVIQ